MTATSPAAPTPAAGSPDALADLLAGYLLASPAYRWPGADGLLLDDVLSEYPDAAAARAVPGEAELCDRHPHLAARVVAFFFLHTAGHHHD